MRFQIGYLDLLKYTGRYFWHKWQQYRLSTYETIIVATDCGEVRGLKRKELYDEEPYYAFEGIPYAKPPLGRLRFRAPEPIEPWQGVWDCTYARDKPLQSNMLLHFVEGTEDCLYLNIYAKNLNTKQPLPVIVWLYGGGYQVGEATRDVYSPDYFMKKDVIFVSISYRLGALGFISFNDPKLNIPGNAGIKDQILGLRWLQRNIANFNGDPNNITLMGESAGAGSVHILMMTEQARGLFHKVILQSGSALCPWNDQLESNWNYRLAQKLDYCGPEIDENIYDFLMTTNMRTMIGKAAQLLTEAEFQEITLFVFCPVIEPYDTEFSVIRRPRVEMMAAAWGNSLPMMIGGTSFEGLFCYQFQIAAPVKNYPFRTILPHTLKSISTEAEIEDMLKQLKSAYFGDPNRTYLDVFEALDIYSYRQIWHGVHRVVLARLAYASDTPTYLYRFDFDSPTFNHFRILLCGNKIRGVSHADDLSYLFYNILSTKLDKSTPEYRTIERMIGMWTSFAQNGDPNCVEIADEKWPPLQVNNESKEEKFKCFNISYDLEYKELPEYDKLKVWDSFYKNAKLF